MPRGLTPRCLVPRECCVVPPPPPPGGAANAQALTKQAKRLSTHVRWNTNGYHNDKRAGLPNIAAYAYQDVHVWSALRPAGGPGAGGEPSSLGGGAMDMGGLGGTRTYMCGAL